MRAESSPRLIEMCWRATRSDSGQMLTCGIYRSPYGIEVRATYGANQLLRSQPVSRMRAARELAKCWRAAVLHTGSFIEVDGVMPAEQVASQGRQPLAVPAEREQRLVDAASRAPGPDEMRSSPRLHP